LRHVSFELRHGEVLGLVGRNGAGKSVLLKLLCRITRPTEGCATIRGRVGSMLEVGAGFDPELTGRENVFLTGAVLGIEREAIVRHFDEIVHASGVGAYLDTPVKRYSSGMYLRLAFASAVHLRAEILLVDEVLAVADQAFQAYAMAKLEGLAAEGRSIVYVSHDPFSTLRLCRRALLLEGGRLVADGAVEDVLHRYRRDA
jgi:lipopolysaccharide transport system ATP-binding protein